MVAGAVLRGLQPHHRHLLHHLHQALQDPGEKEVETGLKHTGEESHRKKSNGRRCWLGDGIECRTHFASG